MNVVKVEANGQGSWIVKLDDVVLVYFSCRDEAEDFAQWLSARLGSLSFA